MRIYAVFAFVLLVAASGAPGAEEPAALEFKGVPLRATEAQLTAQHPWFKCRASKGSAQADRSCRAVCDAQNRACRDTVTYAGVVATSITAAFYNDELHRVTILVPTRHFEQIAGALREVLGQPASSEIKVFRSGRGAELANNTYTWRHNQASLVASRYSGDIRLASVRIETSFAAEELARRRSGPRKRGAKDL